MDKRLRRNFLTGEWEEVDFVTESGRATFVHRDGEVIQGTGHREDTITDAWAEPAVSRSMGVPKHQEAALNAAMKEKGIKGVHFHDGKCHMESRRARNAVLAHFGKGDADAGYGDRPPGG
jgi:hypothetical protein